MDEHPKGALTFMLMYLAFITPTSNPSGRSCSRWWVLAARCCS
jgi:hypothetical protein